MSNWNKLRNRLKETNRDLDDEFEQFLDESLSEDSVLSPRNKTPDLKRKDFKTKALETSKPWWESSVEDESSKDTVGHTWFKTTEPVKEEQEEEIHEDDPVDKENLSDERVSKVDTNVEVPQDTGVSVTISKDSLDDGTGLNADSEKNKLSDNESPDSVHDQPINEDEDDSYTEPTGTPTSTPSPRRESYEGMREDGNTETGTNTQKEQEEKREFFEKLEDENVSKLDYHKLNEMLDEQTSATDLQGRTVDILQATGVELGNSIFNTTGFGGAEVTPHAMQRTNQSPEKESSKPTMLSKVSLMDSLESSMGTAHQEKIKEIRQKHIDLPAAKNKVSRSFQDPIDEDDEYSVNIETGIEEEKHDVMKTEGTGTEFLNTSAANELADLQEALRAAHMVTTSDNMVIQGTVKSTDGAAPNLTEVNTDRNSRSLSQPYPLSKIIDGIDQLRPVIASTEEPKGVVSYTTSHSNPELNQTIFLSSAINAAAQEQQGIILPRNTKDENLKSVLGTEDIFQARQTGFPAYLYREFVLPESRLGAEDPGFDERGLSRVAGVSSRIDDGNRKTLGDARGRRPADEDRGSDVEPGASSSQAASGEDTPPPDSLKGIKSIVKKKQELRDKTRAGHARDVSSPKPLTKMSKSGAGVARAKDDKEGRGRQGRAKTKKDIGDRSRFGWRNSPDSTPTRGKKGITGKERKEKRDKSPKKQHKVVHESSPRKLAASVESFAKYLTTFVQHEGDKDGDWLHENDDDQSLDERLRSKRLSREQALQKEVEHWRSMWHEERKQCEKLTDELTEKDKEWKRREKGLRLEYSSQMNDLKQNVFVLESKLKDVNIEMDSKKRVAKGGSLKGMSDDELRKLEKEIRDQDQLLTGYQQQNERLYEDLKDAQVKSKTAETQMFKENQKLATEVASLKEKLERKEGVFEAAGAAALGAERIHQLHSQVQLLKKNEQEMRKEIDDLESERRKLEKKVKNLERERDTTVKKTNEVLGTNSQTLQEMESTHSANVERLNRKLKWYVENQDLLDKDAASLKKKDEEIQELQELVQRLEAERGKTTLEKDKKEKERAVEAKKIQDLERQVREMEQIIKRRYPNSIPALIYAASAAPGDGKPMKPDDSPKKSNTPSYAFLGTRVKRLERELEEREEEWCRSFRVLEQKYNGMQLEYEGHVKELQREVTDARESVTSSTHTRAHMTTLEKELDATREKNERKTRELQAEVNVLREALQRAAKTEETGTEAKVKRIKRDSKSAQKPKGNNEDLEVRLKSLQEECEKKDRVLEELRSTCAQLQREREEILSEKTTLVSQRNLQERLDVMNVEKRQFREQLSKMDVELDQQRVRYQGSLAEVERMARQEREASHDELCSLRTQHKKEIENIREEYATQHSRSKMAEMSNKIASLEIVIERLKDKLAKSAETDAELASKKLHEELLKQEIYQLKNDLKKARQFHTPQMQHYSQLEDKIAAMETRHRQREHELQAVIHKTKFTADVERDEVLEKWRKLLRKKTEETERFRVELDGILSVLEELRQSGVVIPSNKIARLHCS